MFQKHTLELLTEGQFGTVSAYFEYANRPNNSRSQEEVTVSNRMAPVYASSDRKYPWAPEVEAKFPFVGNAIPKQLYTYKVTPELHALLRSGDSIIVPASSQGAQQFSVAKIWMVHPAPQIDYDAPFEYKWVVQKIDIATYLEQVAQEENFRNMLREVQKAQERDKVRASVLASMQQGGEAYQLFSKAMASIGAPIPAPAPTAPVPPVPPLA